MANIAELIQHAMHVGKQVGAGESDTSLGYPAPDPELLALIKNEPGFADRLYKMIFTAEGIGIKRGKEKNKWLIL